MLNISLFCFTRLYCTLRYVCSLTQINFLPYNFSFLLLLSSIHILCFFFVSYDICVQYASRQCAYVCAAWRAEKGDFLIVASLFGHTRLSVGYSLYTHTISRSVVPPSTWGSGPLRVKKKGKNYQTGALVTPPHIFSGMKVAASVLNSLIHTHASKQKKETTFSNKGLIKA